MAKIVPSKPHPRFGATKKQAVRYAAEREHLNKIFELEQELERLKQQVEQEWRTRPPNLGREIAFLEGRVSALVECFHVLATGKVAEFKP